MGDIYTHVCKYKRAQEVADNLKTLLTDKTTEVGGGSQPVRSPTSTHASGPVAAATIRASVPAAASIVVATAATAAAHHGPLK